MSLDSFNQIHYKTWKFQKNTYRRKVTWECLYEPPNTTAVNSYMLSVNFATAKNPNCSINWSSMTWDSEGSGNAAISSTL